MKSRRKAKRATEIREDDMQAALIAQAVEQRAVTDRNRIVTMVARKLKQGSALPLGYRFDPEGMKIYREAS